MALIRRFVDAMQPRDARVAARTATTLCLVAALAPLILDVVFPSSSGVLPVTLSIAVPLAVLALGWALRRVAIRRRLPWVFFPFLCIAVITAMNVFTADTSVSAQVFLFFPVLYAASQLRLAGVYLVTGSAVIGDLIVVFLLQAPRVATVNAVNVNAALITAAFLLARGAAQQARLVAELETLATVDPLTGLVTRRRLDEAVERASVDPSLRSVALILVDIDHFKSINDSYGHPVGDRVLIEIAGVLGTHARRADVVSRLGGDELALLLPGCGSMPARRRAEQIAADVRSRTLSLPDGNSVAVTVSVGVAQLSFEPGAPRDVQPLYAAADRALYEAKRRGRDQVWFDRPDSSAARGEDDAQRSPGATSNSAQIARQTDRGSSPRSSASSTVAPKAGTR